MTENMSGHSHAMNEETKGSYASVNGLAMYYEIHGTGFPLVLLHGTLTTIEMFAALLAHLGIEQADVFGYSTGGSVALYLALRHPGLVRKLALASTVYDIDGYY